MGRNNTKEESAKYHNQQLLAMHTISKIQAKENCYKQTPLILNRILIGISFIAGLLIAIIIIQITKGV